MQTINVANQVLAAAGRINPTQISTSGGLSEISTNLGTVVSGEIRMGVGIIGKTTPAFTGVRIGYPPITYGSRTYYLAGISEDAVLCGIDTDGFLFVNVYEIADNAAAKGSPYNLQDGAVYRTGDVLKVVHS
jgi:hypothetical protein